MEGGQSGGGGGSPAPFLLKTYEMVDDSSTDDIVSWSSARTSFVVWNPPEFSRVLLPSYFKHNNFSSFIRQLNTYGFRKIDPERWEFSNEEFIKDQKHLLKNIHRRKPIHSHSHPPGSLTDSERAALEEEIEGLSREKTALQASLWKFKHQQSGTKAQLEDLERRLQDMEQRQVKMLSFLAKAVQNPSFVEHLVRMAGVASIDFSVIHKKRRLPEGDSGQEVLDNHSSTSKLDFGHLFDRDFSNKLKLELSPAVSDGNLVSLSTQSSIEEFGSPHRRHSEGAHQRTEGLLPSVPETHELSDTGASFCSRKNVPFPWQARDAEEGDGHISCHLNLTLAHSPLQLDKGHSSVRSLELTSHEMGNPNDFLSNSAGKEDNHSKAFGLNQKSAVANATVSSLQEATPISNQMPRVNDVFWEQFLTERPGSSDIEEASSSLSTNPHDEKQEEMKSENDKSRRDGKDMEQLTL